MIKVILRNHFRRNAHQERTNGVEPNVGTFVGRRINRQAQFIEGGVLRIWMKLRLSQHSGSTTSVPKVQGKFCLAASRKFISRIALISSLFTLFRDLDLRGEGVESERKRWGF